ncbi:MAG TPA: EI24 domain-containing protein [Bacteriovoracaceae bacterium]|nr:EI24 domain-containing protein [Bacteriovoracaceae bacterium]
MTGVFRSLPVAVRMIVRDPVNLILALIPTLIALAIYVFGIVAIFKNADYFGVMIQNYIPDQQIAGWVGKLLTAIFLIFIFLIMSWTYVLMVGIIAAPFNSMLSSRIENILVGKPVQGNKKSTFKDILSGIGRTFKDEFQKLFFILLLTILAMLLNLFPLFYPVGIFILALLISIQFVDYSWSRHNFTFGACVKDTLKNAFPYAGSGFLFLILITVPLINSLVPALATSYYTVLWLDRQKRLPQ